MEYSYIADILIWSILIWRFYCSRLEIIENTHTRRGTIFMGRTKTTRDVYYCDTWINH